MTFKVIVTHLMTDDFLAVVDTSLPTGNGQNSQEEQEQNFKTTLNFENISYYKPQLLQNHQKDEPQRASGLSYSVGF